MSKKNKVPCLILQNSPPIYTAIILGKWFLKHSTPVWRLKDPEKGFQRIVRQERTEQMAAAVLMNMENARRSVVLARA